MKNIKEEVVLYYEVTLNNGLSGKITTFKKLHLGEHCSISFMDKNNNFRFSEGIIKKIKEVK